MPKLEKYKPGFRPRRKLESSKAAGVYVVTSEKKNVRTEGTSALLGVKHLQTCRAF